MAMTFDATLKDMARESPRGFLAAFDRPPSLRVKLLNVDLSTVTSAADLILGLGEPLEEVIHFEFQSSAAAWKHDDLLAGGASNQATHRHSPAHGTKGAARVGEEDFQRSTNDGRIRYLFDDP